MQTALAAYQARINEAHSRERLEGILRGMDPGLVREPLSFVRDMSEAEFGEWRTGWDMMTEGNHPREWWVDKYLDLLVPPPVARMWMFMTEEA